MRTYDYLETCLSIVDVDDSFEDRHKKVTLRTDHNEKSNTAYFSYPHSERSVWKRTRTGEWVTEGECDCCQQRYRLRLPKHLYVAIALL